MRPDSEYIKEENMNFKSFEELIRFAIDKEQEAIDFYEETSKQEPYSGGKATFQEFAGEERKHRALLEGFLKGERKLDAYSFEWIPDMKRSDYMVDFTYRKGMPYADILRLAMKREEKALKLYNDLAGKSQEKDLAQVFKMLSQEEAKHKLRLETMYDDYVAKMGD
jgi:rubrerythrin